METLQFLTREFEAVDESKGILHGVSVISQGEAKGHDLHVDEETLTDVKTAAKAYKGGVKVKMNHGSGVDEIVGALRAFRVEGRKLLANLHLLKSHHRFQQIIELAKEIPDTFGLSIAFIGESVQREGKKWARCKELLSADLVSEPAANPTGLFEVRVTDGVDTTTISERPLQNMPTETAPAPEPVKTFEAEYKSAQDTITKLEAEKKQTVDSLASTATELEAAKAKIAELEKAASTLEQKVAEEMGKLGAKPVEIPVEKKEPTKDELMAEYNEIAKTNFAAAREFWLQHEDKLQDPRWVYRKRHNLI